MFWGAPVSTPFGVDMAAARAKPSADPAFIFAALADPTRRELLNDLAASGPMNGSALASSYSVSRQAIAKHLAVLLEAGIVGAERHGNEVRYGIVAGSLEAATTWLERVGGQWDRRLVALQKRIDRS